MGSSQDVSRSADVKSLISCFCIACVFVILRTAARWYKIRRFPLHLEDWFIYGALASFAIMMSLYLSIIPILFRVYDIEAGIRQPYARLEADLEFLMRLFFVVQLFFWLTLWMVKWCLMFTFKKLTTRLPTYAKIWWGVFIATVVIFIGLCASDFTSCSSMHAWFAPNQCNTPRDLRAKNISLWLGLGGDLLTDLLIMAVPVRALWSVKISPIEKLSIGFVFTVGIITMITAIIRSVTLEANFKGGQISPQWLIMWSAIENIIAIVVGCLPSFAIFIRIRLTASRARDKHDPNSTPMTNNSKSKSFKKGGIGIGIGANRQDGGSTRAWGSMDSASDKSLVLQDGDIVVTHTWAQSYDVPERDASGERVDKGEPGPEYELEIVGGAYNHAK